MKALPVVAALAVFVGIAFGTYFAVEAQQDEPGQEGKEATVANIEQWLNPPGADKYPPIVARVISGEFSVDMTGKALARAINKAQEEGRPISEREARDELVDGAVFDLAVQKRGLEATEERARELYEAALACLSGTPTAVAGMSCSSPPPPEIQAIGDYVLANSTEEELIQAYQKAIGLGRLRSEVLKGLTAQELNNPEIVNQAYSDFVQKEKESIVVIDIDFGADGETVCSEGDVRVTCPPDILALTETPIAVPTRQGEE